VEVFAFLRDESRVPGARTLVRWNGLVKGCVEEIVLWGLFGFLRDESRVPGARTLVRRDELVKGCVGEIVLWGIIRLPAG
jgi:hypothetical protein